MRSATGQNTPPPQSNGVVKSSQATGVLDSGHGVWAEQGLDDTGALRKRGDIVASDTTAATPQSAR